MANDLSAKLSHALADRYTLERRLGSGGMATVFLARDLNNRRPVAIKVLQPDLALALGAERFLREIEIAANLSHPHILPLYDSGEAGGLLYYVMPHAQAPSLRERLNEEKQLSLEEALRIAREVADALGYAHNQGVVHRDIKPENVLFQGAHAVVADFGIARAISAAGEQRLTQTGLVVGTPSYMSPEHATGSAVLDGRSDIYALGCVLYEMLAGQPPFTGPSVESVVHQHVAAELPSITAIRSNVPEEVAAVLRKAMAKTPADRYSTGAEFAKDLEIATAYARPVTAPVALGAGGTGTVVAAPRRGRLRLMAALFGLGATAVVAGVALFSLNRTPAATRPDALRLTVLPFQSLGESAQEYFADGITDEITVRLGSVAGLTIIARQSAIQYKNTTKTPQEIGEELGVDYMLLATISWQQVDDQPSRVRVRPQLIRAADASQVWARVYDAELTEVFEVQSDIAGSVVEALGVALLDPERRSLQTKPTDNLEAYDFFLQGTDYFKRPASEEHYRAAEAMYTRALSLDPNFANAAAQLSTVHSYIYWYYFDRSEDRLMKAREAVDRALAIAPDLPEAHRALGELYYRGFLDYDRALEEFALASEGRPDNSELLMGIGGVERRQGKWEDAAKRMARAAALEPRSASHALQTGITYLYQGDHTAAERYFARAMSLAPDQMRPRVWLSRLYLTWQGDTARVRSLFATPRMARPRVLDPQAWWHWALFRILDGPSQVNADRLAQILADSSFRYSAAGEFHDLRNVRPLARVYYDSARAVLEARVTELPDEARFRSELGLVYAGLGRGDDAVREGTLAVSLLPVSKEALLGPDLVRNLAQIYMRLGMYESAIDQLERLVSIPSSFSHHWLELDPTWNALRDQPRYQQLVGRNQ